MLKTICRWIWSVFLSISFMDKFFLECEYLGALDEFEAGELGI